MQKETFEEIVGVRRLKCHNAGLHSIKVLKYGDSSIWVCCPEFGWYEDPHSGDLKLGCKDRKTRCRWFFSV